MIYQLKSYIKFLFKSTNQHGVHSPFVYDLLTKCVYKKEQNTAFVILKKHRKNLLNNNTTIDVTDFGSGSRVFKSNTRIVSKIAKVAGITPKRQKLLFKLIHYFQPSEILEIGTSLGIATVAMSLAKSSATINTVEGCPETLKKATEHFSGFNLNNITTHNVSFDEYFRSIPKDKYIDFAFIDGNHTELDTLKYFESLLPHCHNNTILIFDDIYWSKEMTTAWIKIIENDKVTVSIDSYKWGLVFFRTEQLKQHFTLRL